MLQRTQSAEWGQPDVPRSGHQSQSGGPGVQGPGLAQAPAQPWQCYITATGKELMQSNGHKNLSSRKQTSAHIAEEMVQKHLQPPLIFTIAGKY